MGLYIYLCNLLSFVKLFIKYLYYTYINQTKLLVSVFTVSPANTIELYKNHKDCYDLFFFFPFNVVSFHNFHVTLLFLTSLFNFIMFSLFHNLEKDMPTTWD